MITCRLVDSAYPGILKIARVRNYAHYSAVNSASRRMRTSGQDDRPRLPCAASADCGLNDVKRL